MLYSTPLFSQLMLANTGSSAFVIDCKLGWGNQQGAPAQWRLKKNA